MARLDRMARPLNGTRAGAAIRPRPLRDASAVIGDPDALREMAAADGYLFVRNAVSRSTARLVRAEVLAACARRGWLAPDAPTHKGIARAGAAEDATQHALLALQPDIQIRPSFGTLRTDPGLLTVLKHTFAARPASGYGDVCRLVFPAALERTTPPHQDHFYIRGSTAMWTAWIPLGDCPISLGGLAVLPGSHTSGLRPHDVGEGNERAIDVSEDAGWAGASYRLGDVLLFNALTVHRALPNLTANRIRLSADFRYQPA